jgi:hypothetical protein
VPGHEVDYLPPSVAGKRNGWKCISIPSIRLHVLDMNNFNFYLVNARAFKFMFWQTTPYTFVH